MFVASLGIVIIRYSTMNEKENILVMALSIASYFLAHPDSLLVGATLRYLSLILHLIFSSTLPCLTCCT